MLIAEIKQIPNTVINLFEHLFHQYIVKLEPTQFIYIHKEVDEKISNYNLSRTINRGLIKRRMKNNFKLETIYQDSFNSKQKVVKLTKIK